MPPWPVRHVKGLTMKRAFLLLPATALALTVALPAFAQDRIIGIQDLDDRIEDIEDDVADDMARSEDAARFGFPEYQPGFSGSASLGYVAQSGSTDSQEFNLGVRMRFAQGQLVQTIGIAADFAEGEDAISGVNVKTKEDIFAIYDANYYLNDRFYLFALARVERDGLPAAPTDITRDAYFGVGPGYRVINRQDMAWRLQAGVGASYLRQANGDSDTEVGYIASSRFFWEFSDSVFLTNDTDVLSTDSSLRANNDLGVNFKVSDTLSTRVSYLTEYNDENETKTDNRLGISLVVGF